MSQVLRLVPLSHKVDFEVWGSIKSSKSRKKFIHCWISWAFRGEQLTQFQSVAFYFVTIDPWNVSVSVAKCHAVCQRGFCNFESFLAKRRHQLACVLRFSRLHSFFFLAFCRWVNSSSVFVVSWSMQIRLLSGRRVEVNRRFPSSWARSEIRREFQLIASRYLNTYNH